MSWVWAETVSAPSATVAASISVTRPGASTSMPTRDEIDAVLEQA